MQACEKEARERNIALHALQRPVVNQNTPVAQPLEMVKSEINVNKRRTPTRARWVVNRCLKDVVRSIGQPT